MREVEATIAAVFGANVRRIRADQGLTIDDLARRMPNGGKAQGSTVSVIESARSGRSSPTVPMVVTIAAALGVTLQDLLMPQNPTTVVTVTPDLQLDSGALRSFLAGDPLAPIPCPAKTSLAEQRISTDLGATPEAIDRVAQQLWGRGFLEERDVRAGIGASAQQRGRWTRQMKSEIRAALSTDDRPRPVH